MLNDMVGVLECAKLELYRRMARPMKMKRLKTTAMFMSEYEPVEHPCRRQCDVDKET